MRIPIPLPLPDAVGFQQRFQPVLQRALRLLPNHQIVLAGLVRRLQHIQMKLGVQHPVVVVRPVVFVLGLLVLIVANPVLTGIPRHNDTLPHRVALQAVGIAAVAPEGFQTAPDQLHRHLPPVGRLRRIPRRPVRRLPAGIIRFLRQHQQHVDVRLHLVVIPPRPGTEQHGELRLLPPLRQLRHLPGSGVVFLRHFSPPTFSRSVPDPGMRPITECAPCPPNRHSAARPAATQRISAGIITTIHALAIPCPPSRRRPGLRCRLRPKLAADDCAGAGLLFSETPPLPAKLLTDLPTDCPPDAASRPPQSPS